MDGPISSCSSANLGTLSASVSHRGRGLAAASSVMLECAYTRLALTLVSRPWTVVLCGVLAVAVTSSFAAVQVSDTHRSREKTVLPAQLSCPVSSAEGRRTKRANAWTLTQ